MSAVTADFPNIKPARFDELADTSRRAVSVPLVVSCPQGGVMLPAELPPKGAVRSAAASRAALIAGCAVAVGMGLVQHTDARMAQDGELLRLLQGMALIKAALALAAVGAVFWRLSRPVSVRATSAYLAGAWLMAGSSALIWQVTLIPLAALAFHAGMFAFLVAAWRDGMAAGLAFGKRKAA